MKGAGQVSDFDMDAYLLWRQTHPPIKGGAEDEEEDGGSAESADDAQSAEVADGSPPPWGDDFDPARAWQTITHLRDRERELETSHKRLKSLETDEQARREWLAERGYEIDDGEEDDEDDDEEFDDGDDPHAAQIRELAERQKAHDEWIAQQTAEREQTRFESDLKRFVGDRELSAKADRAIRLEAAAGQLGPKDLEKLVEDWLDHEGSLRQSGIEQLKSSKKAPHVPTGGNAGRGPQPDLTTTEGRAEHFRQRMAGG